MLKRRVLAVVLVRDGLAVQSIDFQRYLPVAEPGISVEYYNAWGADEIVLLDIMASRRGRCIDDALVRRAAANCFVPLTVGGGLSDLEDIRATLEAGADKVSLNSSALANVNFVSAAANRFGSQCIVVSVDVRHGADGRYEVHGDRASRPTGHDVVEFAKALEAAGAGEILLNAADRDGRQSGFDLALCRQVADAVGIPVIAIGGAGEAEHFVELFEGSEVSAAGAANYFNYTEHSITTTKAYLLRRGIDVRLDSHVDYAESDFSERGRIARHTDEHLQAQFWEYHPPEII
jgi:imidazole glycerol-phosphate synthase subunit HisF